MTLNSPAFYLFVSVITRNFAECDFMSSVCVLFPSFSAHSIPDHDEPGNARPRLHEYWISSARCEKCTHKFR